MRTDRPGPSNRGRRLLCVALSLLWIGASRVYADYWYEHYKRGEDAIKAADWRGAITELTQCVEQKAEPSPSIRTYGMNFISYFPYLKLGIAYYNLGQFDRALKAFETERSFGAIARSRVDENNLLTFQKLAGEEVQKARQLTEQQRITAIVAKSLQDARAAEGKGSIDEALKVVGTGLAVDPDNAELDALMKRLKSRVEEEDKARSAQETVARRLAEGKGFLQAGKYDAASASFNQVLAVKPGDAEAGRLLAESQSKLKETLESERNASARQTMVNDTLLKAEALMREVRAARSGPDLLPRIKDALAGLQSVLALEPGHPRAAELQGLLLQARGKSESLSANAGEIARLLDLGVGGVEKGQYEDSLVALTRVIAMDPSNGTASKYLGLAYKGLNESLLASGAPVPTPKRPPIVVLANRPNHQGTPEAEGAAAAVLEERVSSPDFVLSGVILDDQPDLNLSVITTESSPSKVGAAPAPSALTGTPEVQVARVGDLYQYSFTQRLHLRPGVEDLRVLARDTDGLTDEKTHVVNYLRPAWRSPWAYAVWGLVTAAGLGGLQGLRIRKRNDLLKRRFNPFIAGAPVLSNDLFLGRDALVSRVLQTIHNNSILLYGERRIGKTSLQHHIMKRLQQVQDPEYEFHPVYIDLQGTPQERFFATLAHEIVNEMKPKLDGKIEGPAGAEDSSYSYDRFVRDIHAVLKQLRQQSSKRVKLVLLIDEVDELNDYDPKINQKLRSLFMKSFAEDMVAVVSGVGIKKHWASEGSPWYNFFEEIEVKPFRREDAVELIEKPIRGVFRLDEGVVDRILERTNCRPYLIQKACIALVNKLHEERRRQITVADVEALERPEG